MGSKITGLRLSNVEIEYIDSILEVLDETLSKEKIASQAKLVIDNYAKVPINGLIRGIITDLECHLGLYQSKINDFKFKGTATTFPRGIESFKELFNTVKKHTDFELPENIYQIYSRWILFNNERIEVETVLYDNWNYFLFKDKQLDDYYFSIMLNKSAAYWDKVFKVDESIKPNLKSAIKLGKKKDISLIVDTLRSEYYTSNL